MPMVYKATNTINRKRFEIFTCINPKIASKVEEREKRSAFFILLLV